MYSTNGPTDEVWGHLFNIVQLLGRDGVSSDQTEVEDGPMGSKVKVCRVKLRAWRAKWLDRYLELIDQDRNLTNAYGNFRAGNVPRIRKRPAWVISEDIWVPTGLPRNFYSDDWYNSLNEFFKRKLGAKPPIHIPDIEVDRYN